MRKAIAVLVLTAAASLAGSTSAQAQGVRGRLFGGPRVFTGPGGPTTLTPGYGYSSSYAAPASVPGQVKPYSYYVLPSGVPSREYSGEPTVFPFYGKPYGHPYDRWTWTYMTGPNDSVLSRYYYPPLN